MRRTVLIICIVMLFLVAEVSLIYGKKPPNPDDPPDDPPTSQTVPWGVDRIDADKVWGANTGEGIKVAVLDTGISSHEDLAEIDENNKADFTGTVLNDTDGHGTRIAGVIGALNNDLGVVGVAPGVALYSVKFREDLYFLPEDYNPEIIGSGRRPYLYAAMDWCINNDIQVINMSFGIWTALRNEDGSLILDSYGNPQKDKPLHDAEFYEKIQQAYLAGIVMIAAAGNDNGRVINNYDSPSTTENFVDENKEYMFPASYPEVIGVSATRKVGKRDYFASFSNVGPAVDLAAPGQGIETTDIGEEKYTETAGGTSYSCPHVAGVAALVLKANPSFSPDDVYDTLTSTAEWIRSLTPDQQGAGMVDAEAAVNSSSGAPPRYRLSPVSKLSVTWGKLKR